MNFYRHTENWFKGETHEGGMVLIFGCLLLVFAIYFWKLGHVPTYKSLVVPFLLLGLFWSIAGGVGIYRNKTRMHKFHIEYKKDPVEFVKNEKNRVETFSKWYRPLLITWSILIVIGLVLFNFWGGNLGRAVGIAVILFGVIGLMIDHTSENNARTYHSEIINTLNR